MSWGANQTFTGLWVTQLHTQVPQFDGRSPSLTEIWDIISPTKLCLMTKSHILRQTARTEFLPQRFYFFQKHFFEFRFMQNVLRDFQKKYIIKSDHFLSHFPARNSKIWYLKIISWRSARKNKENVHLRFFIFETSSQRFLSNMLRDFQKSLNYKKY